ncbi:hypothetical protein DXG03_006567 [Asterophora parasitica]|uniref:Transcription elongation factor Eaf N-terminal domain-containing protein n=1 Tax=Asterophora parasitica TaxID=117018 RepID=A0A9P7GDD6_9AGAR|nr:hypothetical protein DXG03_006567 [Asterophora parasitica]
MSNSWMPPKGRHTLTAGTSLTRALNARKSKGTAPATKFTRDFYSFRYNFRPPSVDPGERGKIVVTKGKEATTVTVERPSTQPGEAHQWLGKEIPAKEWECVLIYDEATETYTLEKLDSHMTLTHQYKPVPLEPAVRTPPAQPEPPKKHALTYEEELERELAAAAAEVDAEGDDDLEEIQFPKKEEEEEDEDEEIVIASAPPPNPARSIKSAPAPAPTPAPAAAPPLAPKQRPVPSAPIPTPAPKPSTRPKVPLPRGKKREPSPPPPHHFSDADEEVLQFGKPAKRARPTPPAPTPVPAPPVALALPGASTSVYRPPPPPPPVSKPAPVHAPVLEPEPGSESEEEDWDEVAAVTPTAPPPGGADTEDDFDIFGDALGGDDGEGEDIDMNELEREINQQMDLQMDEGSDGEDFLEAAMEEVPISAPPRGAPMSLKELAGAGDVTYASDDDYSSSDESDDD